MKIFLTIAALIVLLLLLMAVIMVVKNRSVPANLGVKDGQLAALPKSPNAVSTQSADADRRVSAFPFIGGVEETRAGIKSVLHAHGGIEIKTESNDYIHAVSTTEKMKYHDDLEFYFDEKEKLVHFRSASRVGYSDMGLNRERYNHLIELYHQEH
ncbi:DUF1499 domain-containing protein [Oceanispirochaeta crateris]|uniref:DUF1499 domain-containing protein n=1 Tax=Oceanispirochaeta crateris TaxID=2518645 RepID=A0A5C1QLJ5_9SPIO|nr:DUF1499 domain-containing protein [Oceanispirochaeta crateris]QEN08089.1 DUF1499 domain-containing protein [Oceanispirochaeta crateris]